MMPTGHFLTNATLAKMPPSGPKMPPSDELLATELPSENFRLMK